MNRPLPEAHQPPAKLDRHEVVALAKQTWSAFVEHDATSIGAALAYYTVLSIAPILLIAVAVAGVVFGPEAARGEVSTELRGLLGPQAASAVEAMIESASRHSGGGLAGIVGAVTLLAGATSVFVGLRTALNRMWDAHPQRASGMLAWIRGQALSFAMVLAVGFLLLVSLVLSAALSALQRFVEGGIEVPFAVQAANLLTSLAVITLLFATIYKYLPDTQISWSDVGVGAFATAVLFTIGKFLIGEYLGNSSLASTYGAAGSLVVLLVWVYYSAQIVLFGAEFTHVWAVRRGSRCGEERSER